MGDRIAGAEAARKLLKEDERLRKRIFAFAFKLTRNLTDAKDLAQDAMARAMDPERSPWDRDEQPDLLLHVGSLMNSDVAHRRRANSRHRHEAYDASNDLQVRPEPTVLDRMLIAEETAMYQRWMDVLLAALAGDGIALGKIGLMYEGIEGADEQAAQLKCTVKDIYRATERIAYHVQIVMREAGESDARRDRALHPKRPDGGPEAEP